PIGQVGDLHERVEGELLVRGGKMKHVVPLTVGRRLSMEVGAVPGGFPLLVELGPVPGSLDGRRGTARRQQNEQRQAAQQRRAHPPGRYLARLRGRAHVEKSSPRPPLRIDPIISLTSPIPMCSSASESPSRILVEEAGSTKFAVPTWMAVAPTRMNSRASV